MKPRPASVWATCLCLRCCRCYSSSYCGLCWISSADRKFVYCYSIPYFVQKRHAHDHGSGCTYNFARASTPSVVEAAAHDLSDKSPRSFLPTALMLTLCLPHMSHPSVHLFARQVTPLGGATLQEEAAARAGVSDASGCTLGFGDPCHVCP